MVNNVSDVMGKVTADKRRKMWWRVLQSSPIVEKIYNIHSSENERICACSDVYVNSCPYSSWEPLASLLYEKDEMTAVDQARSFLPPRGK